MSTGEGMTNFGTSPNLTNRYQTSSNARCEITAISGLFQRSLGFIGGGWSRSAAPMIGAGRAMGVNAGVAQGCRLLD